MNSTVAEVEQLCLAVAEQRYFTPLQRSAMAQAFEDAGLICHAFADEINGSHNYRGRVNRVGQAKAEVAFALAGLMFGMRKKVMSP
jgi:monoamine oxidase